MSLEICSRDKVLPAKVFPARTRTKLHLKVRIALATQGLILEDIAAAIGRSDTLVVFMFQGKHKGFEHRAKILRMLGLGKKDEAEVFCDPPEKPKSRRAA